MPQNIEEFASKNGTKIRVVNFMGVDEVTVTGKNERAGWILVKLTNNEAVLDQVGGDEA
jgi:hypothetical protein